ncbi:hydrogenase [Pseudopontixanthobacter vadosimaris]|uniref:hydrogenase n=1 Tax=Pseudopontixanthobacter vadosimaris TaxID=2726450 RepID=UPI001475FDB5|nr:hydrogenase [Pseudopontixanthobacter vadosimaris]
MVLLGVSGFVLFTIGLLLGFLIPTFRNARMGLSAHLTAVQTGPALIGVALFWEHLSIPSAWSAELSSALIGSSYVLVGGIALAAASGASEALPIAGGSYRANRMYEAVVSLLVKGSSITMGLTAVTISFFAIRGIA